jgi:hypothetical protein
MLKCFGFAMLLAPGLAFSQLDSYTLTVGASRPLNAPPDQQTISFILVADLNTSLDDVLTTLKDAGVTMADLTSVSAESLFRSTPNGTEVTQLPVWSFSIDVPLSSVNSKLAAVARLQNTILQKRNNWALNFYVAGLKTSPGNAPQCSIPDLMTDARAHAQRLADAIGFGVGQVMAIGDSTEASRIFSSSASSTTSGYNAILSGLPYIPKTIVNPLSGSLIGGYSFAARGTAADCAIVVKFRLVGGI